MRQHRDQPIAGPADVRRIEVDAVIARGDTGLTFYEIVRFPLYGPSLLIDGLIQSAASDEAIYHEMLVSPACAFHGNVRRVIVVGGANGGIASRIGHLPNLQKMVHVDTDETLYRICRHCLSHLHAEPGGNYEYDLQFTDPVAWLSDNSGPYDRWADLVVLDLPDPTRTSYARHLYSPAILDAVARLLNEGGALAVHAGSGHPADSDLTARAMAALRGAFGFVQLYERYIPSLAVPWRFAIASGDPMLTQFADLPQSGAIARLPPALRTRYSDDIHRKMLLEPSAV